MVRDWVQALKKWSTWAIGQSPLPDKRARMMLGASLAVLLLVAIGLVLAFGNPATNPVRHNTAIGAQQTSSGLTAPTTSALPHSGAPTVPTTAVPPKSSHSRAEKRRDKANEMVFRSGRRAGRRHHQHIARHHRAHPVVNPVI